MIAPALNRLEVETRLHVVRAAILQLGVSRLALFGSLQRDEAHAASDVDVLVEFAPGQKTYTHLLDLGDLLEDVLQRRVELVTPESLSPFLRPHILAEAEARRVIRRRERGKRRFTQRLVLKAEIEKRDFHEGVPTEYTEYTERKPRGLVETESSTSLRLRIAMRFVDSSLSSAD